MAVSQREVYLLPHPFDSSVEEHPFIVLSVQEANDYENTFVAVMITSSENRRDDFSFNLMDEMFENPLRKDKSHVRMHLLTLCLSEEIVGRRINKMKERYFGEMMATIGGINFQLQLQAFVAVYLFCFSEGKKCGGFTGIQSSKNGGANHTKLTILSSLNKRRYMQTLTEVFDYDKWTSQLPHLSKQYQEAHPYPHIVLENFLNEELLYECSDEFNKLNESDDWINYTHYNEKKKGLNKIDLLPPSIKHTINELNSPEFLKFLSELTGIKNLQKDEHLEGGGVHQSGKGGYLNIHADFTVHPHHRHWQRRINVLVYLNENWQEEWGGKLELWDKQMKACEVKVLPVFNRCVIFNTDADSYHGHPEPTTCPEDVFRRSIALYYYTIEENPFRRSTHYKTRPGEERKKFMVTLDNTMVAVYTRIKGWLGSNDKVVSSVLKMFSGKKKK